MPRDLSTVLRASGFLLMMALASNGLAQTTGMIRGNVKDQDGNALPGVTVTAISDDRGTTRSTISGVTGSFSIASLPVGTYQVEAALDGFQGQTAEAVRVGIGAKVSLSFSLALASVAEHVTVTSTPILDVTSSSVSTNFTAEFIEDLPTTRNFWDMMAVAPGISQQSEGSTSLTAFGSSITSNSWNVDGLDTTSSDTGRAWWYLNPDTIDEVQVLGIGAPAEYGNMTGAAMNVVTKSGTNELKGTVNFYYQDQDLSSSNAEIDGIPFNRDQYENLTATLGGPISRDRVWYFAAYQRERDAYTEPGEDPGFPTSFFSDKYDIKVTASINDSNLIDAKYHYEDYDYDFAYAYATPSASGSEFGTNPAWGISWQSVLGPNNYLEASYAGYVGDDDYLSATGSTEDPFIDYSPSGGGPAQYSGGLWYPYLFDLSRNQVDVKLSHHADDFIGGDHEFKFGVSYGVGDGDTVVGGGLNGVYYYRYEYTYEYYGYEYTYPYYYRVTARPYHYGADSENLAAFVDDSWQVNSRLTVNVGLRYDDISSDIPDFPRLNQDWTPTGETIPGLKNAVGWSLWSPRIGMTYQIGSQGVLRAFYGKFYDANVTGNWYVPPPDAPSYLYEYSDSLDGPWTPFFLFEQKGATVDPNLKPPETDQYTIGYERQFGRVMTLGIQGIYKDSKNLIGWEILGDGVYEMVPWENPFTGEIVELASIIEQPSTQKGNGPGEGSLAPPGQRYSQEYKGVLLTFNKRYSNGWALNGSYTWSDSTGFLPRPLSQSQGSEFYTSTEGRDPNNWINAEQSLQNDRRHMLQLQGTFGLPWKLRASAMYRYLDGKPYNRQVFAGSSSSASPLNQGTQRVIAIPASDDVRASATNVLDLGLGRDFGIGPTSLKVDLQLLNVFNDDAHDWWQTLTVPPGDRYIPDGYIFPRRLMIRLGIYF